MKKLDTKKKITTRTGLPVRIYAVDGGGDYPIHGARKRDGVGWVSDNWTLSGITFKLLNQPHRYDLINPPERTDALGNTVPEELPEFPDGEWEYCGLGGLKGDQEADHRACILPSSMWRAHPRCSFSIPTGDKKVHYIRRATRPDGTPLSIPKLPDVPGYRVEYRGPGWKAKNVLFITFDIGDQEWVTCEPSIRGDLRGIKSAYYAELFPIVEEPDFAALESELGDIVRLFEDFKVRYKAAKAQVEGRGE